MNIICNIFLVCFFRWLYSDSISGQYFNNALIQTDSISIECKIAARAGSIFTYNEDKYQNKIQSTHFILEGRTKSNSKLARASNLHIFVQITTASIFAISVAWHVEWCAVCAQSGSHNVLLTNITLRIRVSIEFRAVFTLDVNKSFAS